MERMEGLEFGSSNSTSRSLALLMRQTVLELTCMYVTLVVSYFSDPCQRE